MDTKILSRWTNEAWRKQGLLVRRAVSHPERPGGRKRSLKEAADLYLSLPVTDRRKANKLLRRQVDPEDIDNQMAMIAGLTDAATEGDARAAAVLVKLLGEETPSGDAAADTLARAAQLLEGIDSAIE